MEKYQNEYIKAAKQMGVHIPGKEEEIMGKITIILLNLELETDTRGGNNTYRQQQRQYQRGARYQRGPQRNFKRNNASEHAFTNVVKLANHIGRSSVQNKNFNRNKLRK
ncbi:hypothetical protein TKK_0017626 [Trichogramma kaykai]